MESFSSRISRWVKYPRSPLSKGHLKENFAISAESRKIASSKITFLQIYRSSTFLQKEHLSAFLRLMDYPVPRGTRVSDWRRVGESRFLSMVDQADRPTEEVVGRKEGRILED